MNLNFYPVIVNMSILGSKGTGNQNQILTSCALFGIQCKFVMIPFLTYTATIEAEEIYEDSQKVDRVEEGSDNSVI